MYRQEPRIQQACGLLTFGADVCTPHPLVELWFGVRVRAPMLPARSTPPQQGMWGQRKLLLVREILKCPNESLGPALPKPRLYRVTSLIKSCNPLGPYRRPMPRVVGGS